VVLQPPSGVEANWRAGDVAEIGPRHAAAQVDAWLLACGADGHAKVEGDESLAAVLARSRLPDAASSRGLSPQQIAAGLPALPHREYSIASTPAEGAVHLLVRRFETGDGQFGLGSGWLTTHAHVGEPIDLRIRTNRHFHAPDDDRPLILIGNGTGIAGLRALLRERIAAGRHRNWLLFGERQRAHDFHYRDEIETWLARGRIEKLDLAFSRDQPTRIYVQDLLRTAAPVVLTWVQEGAVIYVCGSLDGMAPGVDAALAQALGRKRLAQLMAQGRYRRDVY
jgi:sulfite reductase (NADPH) flavoprotein alpha-component